MLTDLLPTGTKEVLQETLNHPINPGSMKTREKQIVCESVFSIQKPKYAGKTEPDNSNGRIVHIRPDGLNCSSR